MSNFVQYTMNDAPAASRALLEQVQKSLGFVPNLHATMAESPAVLAGYLALAANLGSGALSAAEREIVEIAVSAQNGCEYCIAAHSTVASMLRVDPEILRQVRDEVVVKDPKIEALVRFTRTVMQSKGFVERSAVAAFLAAGYEKKHLLEVVGLIGLKTLANYVHALSHAPLDAQFEAQKIERGELVAR